jgi:hypothetical protein
MRPYAVRNFGEAPALHDLPIPDAEGALLRRGQSGDGGLKVTVGGEVACALMFRMAVDGAASEQDVDLALR